MGAAGEDRSSSGKGGASRIGVWASAASALGVLRSEVASGVAATVSRGGEGDFFFVLRSIILGVAAAEVWEGSVGATAVLGWVAVPVIEIHYAYRKCQKKSK